MPGFWFVDTHSRLSRNKTPVNETGVLFFSRKVTRKMITVSKFGGTSMATADSIRQVANILKANENRTICVVSAPGKTDEYLKMTDLLIHNHRHACIERVIRLVHDLHLDHNVLERALAKLAESQRVPSLPNRVAFGEWLSAWLLSHVTGWRMVDADEVVFFEEDRVTVNITWSKSERVIVPGFYGHDVCTGNIRTFPRGGSDITASLVAEKVGATLCENWTDVPGVFDKDPNRHDDAIAYEELSYTQLLQVAHGGAQVFHRDAIAPLQVANIPLRIRSTFAPHAPGTLVT